MTIRTLTGDYIGSLSIDVDDPTNPYAMVGTRFDDTMAKAEVVYTMLIGDGGVTSSGLLGEMQSAIASAPTVSISSPSVDTALSFGTSGLTIPSFDDESLQAPPTVAPSGPDLGTAPTINTDYSSIVAPSDPALVMTWAEANLPATLYTALAAAITTSLTTGDTGINATVEEAIYTRARNRQQVDRLAAYNQINNTALEMQFAYPSGALLSALADFGIGANRQDAEIENTIIVTQAERAQANLQFSLNAAVSLETLIRQTRTDESGRALEYAKSLAAETRELFATKVQKYLAQWEGAKLIVQAESESLKGYLDHMNALVNRFKAEHEAFKYQSDAVASNNKSLVDVFTGRIQGYAEGERAVATGNEVLVRHLAEKIKNAENILRAAVAQAEQTVAGYTAENSIKERFSNDIAQIAANVCASMLSAVHAGASISYSGSESSSQSISIGAHVSESHSAEHDPSV